MNFVRFWAWNPETSRPYRVSLRDGNKHVFYTGGPTDEGFSRSWRTFSLDDGVLCFEEYSEGRDCDGNHSFRWIGECPIDPLPTIESGYWLDRRKFQIPDFKEI